MAAFKRIKQQEIPFILDGKRIIKGVTKNTTCSDVIKKLPNLPTPLAVFESVDGVEKELAGKTKLLKVWRANGSAKKVEFVVRKSQVLPKGKKFTLKHSSAKSAEGKELSKEALKRVSDLAFYIRYQKTKLQTLSKEFENKSCASEQNRLMRRLTSNASVNSMDAFLAKADLNEIAKFLTFCGEVTAEKLRKGKTNRRSVEYSEETVKRETTPIITSEPSTTELKKHSIHKNLESTKLGLKRKFAPKKKVERTTSTGTISSTDTGYNSVGSEDVADETCSQTSVSGLNIPKRQIFVSSVDSNGPRHSTPVLVGRSQKRRADDFESTFISDSTLTRNNLEQMNELQGKTMIFEKFMADQTRRLSSAVSGNDVCDSQDAKKRRMERYSMPAFCSQKDICRFLWNNNCDSDSDSESDISQPCESLDIAFNEGQTTANVSVNSQPRTLRRESAVSNLNRFSLSRDTGLDTLDESHDFDYSFDCSFPRMDETQTEDFSMDFSCDFDDSDSENEASRNEDDSMDSFMKTRSVIDVSGDVTLEL